MFQRTLVLQPGLGERTSCLHPACLPVCLSICLAHRDWEFSWLARNLAPVRNQKIHWISEPGSATMGLNINNRGQIR
jgi:hypothetical protein